MFQLKDYKLYILSLVVILYFFIPLKIGDCLNGFPLDSPCDIFFILLFIWGFFIVEWKKIDREVLRKLIFTLIVLITIKVLCNASLITHGLKGYYYNNSSFSGDYEKSVEFLRLDATRIDKKISFWNVGYSLKKKPFNLWFINEHNDNNFSYSIVWKGFLYVSKPESVRLSAVSNGDSKLFIDNNLIFNRDSKKENDQKGIIRLTQGFHNIEVSYLSKNIRDDVFDLRWLIAGKEENIPSQFLFPEKPSRMQFILDRYFFLLSLLVYYAQFLFLVIIFIYCIDMQGLRNIFKKEKFWLFLFFTVFLTKGFFYLLRSASDPLFNIISRGDDPLIFEWHARLILFGDWLDSSEVPFYFVPFFRYFLAFAHVVFGEGLFFPYLLQYCLILISAVIIYKMTKKLFNINTAVLALLLFTFTPLPNAVIKGLMSEPLCTFFSCFALYCLILYIHGRRMRHLLLSSILLGFAIITRPNIFSYLFFIVPWLFIFLRKESVKRAMVCSILFFFGTMVIVSCLAIRNYITSGKFHLLTSSGSINLLLGNRPPATIDYSAIKDNPIYNFLGLDNTTRQILEYARQEPVQFLKGIVLKLGFIAGVDLKNWGALGRKIHLDKLLTFLFFISGFIISLNKNRYNLKSDFVPVAAFAIIAILTLSIFIVASYGWRLQLPSSPFMMIFAAYFIDRFLKTETKFTITRYVISSLFILAIFHFMLSRRFMPFAYVIYLVWFLLQGHSRFTQLPAKVQKLEVL